MGILKPSIVLCCSPVVFNLARKVYSDKNDFCYKRKSETIPERDIEFAKINGVVYVNFYHPQYYGKTDEVFTNYAVETFECLNDYINSK